MIKYNFFRATLIVLFLSGLCYAQVITDQKNLPQNQSPAATSSHHKPSQAAINACLEKSRGASCSYTTPTGKGRLGTCINSKDLQYFFCKKTKSSKPSQAAIDACLGKSKGVSCGYTTRSGKIRSGACVNSRDQKSLFCKNNRF